MDFTFVLWMKTFEPLELKESYIPHLKLLLCGVNTPSYQWFGCIFILCYYYLNLALLLHKTVLVTFPIGTSVLSGYNQCAQSLANRRKGLTVGCRVLL